MISLWFCTINVYLYWNLIVVLTGISSFRLASTIYCWDFHVVNNGDFFVYDVICCKQFSSCLPLMLFTECAKSMSNFFRSEFKTPKRSSGPKICSTPIHLKRKSIPTILKILKINAELYL